MPITLKRKAKKQGSIKIQNSIENKNYVVAGYNFSTLELAEDAKDELNAIHYMTQKTNQNDPAQIYTLYNKILDKELFKTPVGLNYLKELQQYLYIHKEIPNDRIRPIPVNQDVQLIIDCNRKTAKSRDEINGLNIKVKHFKDLFIRSLFLNLMLLIAIFIMIIIATSGSNPNITNYENKLINKYSAWQEQLESREAVVIEKEKVKNQ